MGKSKCRTRFLDCSHVSNIHGLYRSADDSVGRPSSVKPFEKGVTTQHNTASSLSLEHLLCVGYSNICNAGSSRLSPWRFQAGLMALAGLSLVENSVSAFIIHVSPSSNLKCSHDHRFLRSIFPVPQIEPCSGVAVSLGTLTRHEAGSFLPR